MKFGFLEIVVVQDGNEYFAECKAQGKYLYNFGPYNTYKSAFVLGIEKLKEKVQATQEALNEPQFRQKSKLVRVYQWWTCQKNDGIIRIGEEYWYNNQPIEPGDWIIYAEVVTNKDFEKNYEVVT